ncbi:MAG: DNA double-strand break repair nuclease NurA, partial [Candidatus Bathyarchaeota archaeon]|nr:DNA double-strand break repair nuclease NurA [Candidatus Bathyarchaeota archaeon]
IELSLRSMRNIESEYFQPNEMTFNQPATENFEDATPVLGTHGSFTIESIPLKPLLGDTPVAAVDISSIRIGETETGMLCAIRGAIVWKEKGRYKYLRLGPFPFHITEENKKEIYNLFRHHYFEASEDASAPSLINMQTRMGNLLERWLQLGISCSAHDSIILWDGSLTAGTADSPVKVISQLLEIARNRLNTVLAFSKTTNLRLLGHRLTDLAEKSKPPCLLQISGFPLPSGPVFSLGNVYVAKLTPGICSFRLDIDKKVPRERVIEAVQKLLGSDFLIQSYPETLRLAHIFSTFTATEVIGIQRCIAQQYGLKIIARPNVRRLLFGPFGKDFEG